jgi:uncharacterized protein DUF1572
MSLGETYLQSVIKRLMTYKDLGDKTFAQLEEKDFHFQPNEASNSIAIIIQHMAGNMLSRFTNFLTEDGEKEWRKRDAEFDEQQLSKEKLIEHWENGWQVVFDALQSLTENDLLKTIYIRNEPLSVVDAVNRQLAHYPHHTGQIVYIGKIIRDDKWKSLSIPKGQSAIFNKQMNEKK